MRAQMHLYTFDIPDGICFVINVYELSDDINYIKMH